MIEQKVIIKLFDEYSNYFGTLTISAMDYSSNDVPTFRIFEEITLKNIPVSESPDNVTPIIFYDTFSSNIPKLMFLEETEYQVLFESEEDVNFDILASLTKINKNHFKPFRFSLSDNKKYRSVGTLNFRSYVGKSFLDVRKNGVNSIKIPIEVRSKKIDYFNQYSAMIADLSQHALSLIFELNSPLYQEFEIEDSKRETYYEDFMFLEYLFREDNLPSIFEYLSKNLHSQLKNYLETVPISFAQNINHNTLKNIVSKPNNLFKSDAKIRIVKKLDGYIPIELEQIKHEDIVDTPENRFFKYFLELIQDLIEKLIANPTKKGYVNDQLLFFSDEIEYYLSNKFFRHISAMDYVPFNSQILQKKEGYREIFQYFLMLEASFRLSWDEINNQFKGFEKKLSDLYEYWCYFKMLKVLNDMSIKKIKFEDVFIINKDNWSISIKKGIRSSKKFQLNIEGYKIDVQLFYNLKFSDKLPYISYSLPFKPDYTLLIKIDDLKYYIHFDAKYRSELEIIDVFKDIGKGTDLDDIIDERDYLEEKEYVFKDGDIYKMHTYKDSILKTEGAYVLYPGNKTKRFYESDLIIPSVGAFSLTPGNDDVEEDNLEIFIKEVLKTLLFNCGLIKYEWDSADY